MADESTPAKAPKKKATGKKTPTKDGEGSAKKTPGKKTPTKKKDAPEGEPGKPQWDLYPHVRHAAKFEMPPVVKNERTSGFYNRFYRWRTRRQMVNVKPEYIQSIANGSGETVTNKDGHQLHPALLYLTYTGQSFNTPYKTDPERHFDQLKMLGNKKIFNLEKIPKFRCSVDHEISSFDGGLLQLRAYYPTGYVVDRLGRQQKTSKADRGTALASEKDSNSNQFPGTTTRDDSRGILPGLVYFHGGGHSFGDLRSHDGICIYMAEFLKMVVVSVDYRKAPEYKFPTAILDCEAAFAWVADHSDLLNTDASRLAVGGDSVGGGYALALCCKIRDQTAAASTTMTMYGGKKFHVFASGDPDTPPKVHPVVPMPKAMLMINASVEACPAPGQESESFKEFFGNKYLMMDRAAYDDLAKRYCDDAQFAHPWVDLTKAKSFADLPPTVIISTGFDVYRDTTRTIKKAMMDAGVHVRYSCYTSLNHSWMHLSYVIQEYFPTLQEICDELRRLV